MNRTPYRADGAGSPWLGDSLGVFRRSAFTTIRTVVASCFLLVVVAVPSVANGLEHLEGEGMMSAVAGFLAAIVASVAALALGVRAIRTRDLSVDLRELGLVYANANTVTPVLWDDVRSFSAGLKASGLWMRDGCAITLADGKRVILPYDLVAIRGLRTLIEGECIPRLLKIVSEEIERDRPGAFGPFVVTREGLDHNGRHLSWKDVQGVRVAGRMIAIGDVRSGVKSLPKRDGIVAWATARYDEVPNAEVFVALVAGRARGQRFAPSRHEERP